jgi:hypothetical protein
MLKYSEGTNLHNQDHYVSSVHHVISTQGLNAHKPRERQLRYRRFSH